LHSTFIIGEWARSYEEEVDQNDDFNIFRNLNDYSPPPSRFRESYVFNTDGICSSLQLAPNDAHYFVSCTWKLEVYQGTEILSISYDKLPQKQFEIIKFDAGNLRLKNIKD